MQHARRRQLRVVLALLVAFGCSDRDAGSGSTPVRADAGVTPPAATPSVDAGPSEAGPRDAGRAVDAGEPAPSDGPDAGLEPGAVASDAGASPNADADGGLGVDAGAIAAPDPQLVQLAARLSALSARLSPLARRTVDFWLEHGPDAELGGFHATLDRQGAPIAPVDKGLVQQTRHLWMLSTWYERREASPALRALAERTYAFVRDHFVDADGSFFFRVSRDGARVVDARKLLMAECYAIYGLSTYGRVFAVPEAIELARARFASIDAARHDAANGGYDQRGDPGNPSGGATKDTNTHLHLLEAFTALYQATGDALVGARLGELVDLFATRLVQPSGYVPLEWTPAFAAVGAPGVSYGHDFETSWLLMDAAVALGRDADASVRAAALALSTHAATYGIDRQQGGVFESGVPDVGATDRDKIWWVQFEALAGAWWAFELGAGEGALERVESVLGWIEATEDAPVGEWFASLTPEGTVLGPDYKGDEWKASYHTVRALVYVQDWVDSARAALLRP